MSLHTSTHSLPCMLSCAGLPSAHTRAQELPSPPLKHLSCPCRVAHGQLTVKQCVNILFCHTHGKILTSINSAYTPETPDVLRVWKLQRASMHMACRRQEHTAHVCLRGCGIHPAASKHQLPLGITATDSRTPAHSAPCSGLSTCTGYVRALTPTSQQANKQGKCSAAWPSAIRTPSRPGKHSSLTDLPRQQMRAHREKSRHVMPASG